MARWEKLLEEMRSDPKPLKYTFAQAASILEALGFQRAGGESGSHRIFRRVSPSGGAIRVMLVDRGRGKLKPGYIRQMLEILASAGLLP